MSNQTDLMPLEDLLLVANEVEKSGLDTGDKWCVFNNAVRLFRACGQQSIAYRPNSKTYIGYRQKDRLVQWLGECGVVLTKHEDKWYADLTTWSEDAWLDEDFIMCHRVTKQLATHPNHTKCCLLAAAALIKREEK